MAGSTNAYTPEEQAQIDATTQNWENQIRAGNTVSAHADSEIQEALGVINRTCKGSVQNGIVQPCPGKPKKLNCVNPSQPAGFSPDLQAAVKRQAATDEGKDQSDMKVDLGQIASWEGNYSGAYVPWGPQLKQVNADLGDGKTAKILAPTVDSDGQLVGWKSGNYTNNSGVTVGAGYDLGGKTPTQLNNSLQQVATESGLISKDDAKALATKLGKYTGKKRVDACAALYADPLTLTQSETDAVNYSALKSHLESAMNQYEADSGGNWGDLSAQEQTLVLSQVYHHGALDEDLATDLASGNHQAVVDDLDGEREQSYIQQYYNSLPPPAPAPSRPATPPTAPPPVELPGSPDRGPVVSPPA